MVVLQQSFEPSNRRPLYKQGAFDSWVSCFKNEHRVRVSVCYRCKSCDKVNFNTVHCNYIKP